MKLIFDTRVLTHKTYTGVENYTKLILGVLSKKIDINVSKPKTINKYFIHLWTHLILPFKKGDILFCPANIAPIFVPKNKKLILTIHDIAFMINPQSFSFFFRWYYKFIISINIKRADRIITVSNFSKKEIEKHYPYSKGKIEIIHLGIDELFKPLNIKKKKQILYVGSLNERKNFKSVLEAYEKLNLKDYKLLLVGNFNDNFKINKYSKQIIDKAKQNKNILFLSNISNNELLKLYNESKLLIFPSFYEGFGLPPLEAMACGTSVITSNVSSLPEVGGDAVVYCNPYDVDDIRDKIELVINNENLQKEMIQKGLKRAKQFTWKKSAEKHLKVFKKVLQY